MQVSDFSLRHSSHQTTRSDQCECKCVIYILQQVRQLVAILVDFLLSLYFTRQTLIDSFGVAAVGRPLGLGLQQVDPVEAFLRRGLREPAATLLQK